MPEQAQQKARHDLDDAKLGEYLKDYLPNLKLPIVSTKIGYGQSNPTYFVDDANKNRFILRKKPSGTIISPVAHQVDREYKVLKALGSVDGFPVPKVYCLSLDTSIIGTAFYVRFHCSTCIIVLTCSRSWNLSKAASSLIRTCQHFPQQKDAQLGSL